MSRAKKGAVRALALSTCAVMPMSALVLAGPSANAIVGDSITVTATGPVLDSIANTTPGGAVDISTVNVDPTDLDIFVKDANGDLIPTAAAAITTTSEPGDTPAQAVRYAGFDNLGGGNIRLYVRVNTGLTGGSATYYIVDNYDTAGANATSRQSYEAMAEVTVKTSGPATTVSIDPTRQETVENVDSPDYTLSVFDAAGRATQLSTGEDVDLTIQDGSSFSGDYPYLNLKDGTGRQYDSISSTTRTISAGDLVTGTFKFAAGAYYNSGCSGFNCNSSADGNFPIIADLNALAGSDLDTATLVVNPRAYPGSSGTNVEAGEDNWLTFGDGVVDPIGLTSKFDGTVSNPEDPGSGSLDLYTSAANVDKATSPVVLKFRGQEPGRTISIRVNGGIYGLGGPESGMTIGGSVVKSFTAIVGADGTASISIPVDAATIQEGDGFVITGLEYYGNAYGVVYQKARFAFITADQTTYLSAFGATVNPVLTAVNQFGVPVTGVAISVTRVNGANDDGGTYTTRQAVNASGQVTVALKDTKAIANAQKTDTLFAIGYSTLTSAIPSVGPDSVAQIKYTADGLGDPISFNVDTDLAPVTSVDSPSYSAANFAVETQNDDNADFFDTESAAIILSGGTDGAKVTVSADNGALVTKGEGFNPDVNDGAASQSGLVDVTDGDSNLFRIIGTKTGLVNVTVTSGGRTKTAQITVKAARTEAARNVEIIEPTGKLHVGENSVWAVKVTDAFGNPVKNADTDALSVRLLGNGNLASKSTLTDADGLAYYDVTPTAGGDITLKVTADTNSYDFGETLLTDGLANSVTTDTSTPVKAYDLAALQQALANAQSALTVAQGKLSVAQTAATVKASALADATADVASAKAAVKAAKKAGSGVAAAKAKLAKAKKAKAKAAGALKIANAKVKVAQDAVDAATAAVTAAQAALDAAK